MSGNSLRLMGTTKWFMQLFTKDLKLSKKSARWLTKLTDKEMKKEQVRMCEAFVSNFATVS